LKVTFRASFARDLRAIKNRSLLNRIWVLRKVLNPLLPVESMELIIDKLSKTKTNGEFLASMSNGGR
jgi:transcription termination factor Rho